MDYLLNAEQLYQEIAERFPFLTEEETKNFKRKAEKVLQNTADDLEKAKQLIELLNNPHADWQEIKKKKTEKIKPEFKIEDQILFLRIPTLTSELDQEVYKHMLEFIVANQESYSGIIIDFRGNKGGDSRIADKLARLFFGNNIIHGTLIKRIRGNGLDKHERVLEISGDIYIDKPIILLIDSKNISSAELFIAQFKVSKRATLIGETTKGGSGNPDRLIFKDGDKEYLFRIPTWRFILKGEAKPIEETKITPDIEFPTEGNDIIKFAREYLWKQIS